MNVVVTIKLKAWYQTQPPTHAKTSKNNKDSLAVRSTFFNWTLRNSGYSWKESYQYKLPVIAQGAIINIKATRCDGIMECGDGSDENNGCGMEVDDTILAGKTMLRYIIFLRISFFMYIFSLQLCFLNNT